MSELHDTIARANELLTEQAALLWSAAWCNDKPEDAACLARVATEAEHAADALFSALNTAHSYLADADAWAAMFPGTPERVSA